MFLCFLSLIFAYFCWFPPIFLGGLRFLLKLWAKLFSSLHPGRGSSQEVAPSAAAELPEVRLRLRHNEAQVRHVASGQRSRQVAGDASSAAGP